MSYLAITGKPFERMVTLGEAYRIMEHFASAYLSRGDSPVSVFLHTYASEVIGGETTDPAAAEDFLHAAQQVLSGDGISR